MTGSEGHCTFRERQSHHITNRKWVTLHILWKAISSHHFLVWPTASGWHCTFHERHFHHTFSYDQQLVSDIVKGSLITSFPMINRRWVTLHILWKAVSSYLFLWPTGGEWHCIFCERQSHHIFSYDQQRVSDIVYFVKGSLITSFPMTNSGWVTLHILWKAVSSHLSLWPTGGEWHCIFCERQSHHIFSYDQQWVSDIAHFVKGSLITSFPKTNSVWVTLHILWKAVSLHPFLWPTVCEWHFVKGSLITSFPMTNSQWVKLHILWKAASSYLFLWPTAGEWHCTFCARQSHHIISYDQQRVSDIAHFVKGSLITSFPMTNRMWVTLHILWKVVSSHYFLWPTGSEWHCTFCERQSHHIISYDQQVVSAIEHLLTDCLITFLLSSTACE